MRPIGPTVDRAGSASAARLQPECARVALPGGFADFDFPGPLADFALPGGLAELALPGASAELPRGGLAPVSPLAGGVNAGGFPEPAEVG